MEPVLPPCELNRKRVGWVGPALEAFAKETGLSLDVDRDTAVRDLLGDLMHFCDAWGIDFEAELDVARHHYDVETMECEECGFPHDPDGVCPDGEDVPL